MLRLEKIAPTVWVVYGSDVQDAAKAFIRFQEFYENADLKGKRGLIVRDIERWWEDNRPAYETEPYYTFWAGFNIPGKVITDTIRSSQFRDGFTIKDFLSRPFHYPRWHEQETQFLKLLEDLPIEDINSGYFIGMWEKSEHVLEHEIAHAFYATVPVYKVEQTYNISQLPKQLYDQISTQLKEMGYHSDVVNDEIQAYLSTYIETIQDTFDTDHYDQVCKTFAVTFDRHRKIHTPP